MAPFLLIFGVFTLLPLVSSFAISFTDFHATDVQNPFNVNFVGLQQYEALFANPQFLHSMLNTGYFVVVGIPLTMAVALALAVALNNGISRFRTIFRVGFYIPVVTSIVAISTGWRFLLQDNGP
ncbi:MAG: sugar ABC transporter permease, partial [Leifsonia sp.]